MTFYTNIYINLPFDVIKHIIGKKGSNFVRTSKNCDLKSMWYNKDTNAITLYGPIEVLPNAAIYVRKVIEGYVEKFAKHFTDNIYNTNTMDESCTELHLGDSFSRNDVMHLIGLEGRNLKDITRKSNVYFIWYNAQINSIQIWGTKYHTLNAITMLQDKIQMIEDKLEKQKYTHDANSMKKQKKCIRFQRYKS